MCGVYQSPALVLFIDPIIEIEVIKFKVTNLWLTIQTYAVFLIYSEHLRIVNHLECELDING